jgi:ATP-binding cassette subfamily C protein
MIADVRRAFALLSGATRWRWVTLLPLALAAAAGEAAGAVAVFGLLRVVTDPASAARLPIVGGIERRLPDHGPQVTVLAVTALVILVYIGRNAILLAATSVRDRVVSGSVQELSAGMLRRYLAAPYVFVLRRSSATLIQRVQRATELTVTLVLAATVNLALEGLIAAGLVVLLALKAPLVTLTALVATLALLLLPAAFTSGTFRGIGEEERHLHGRLLQHLQQSLGAAKEVRLAGRERFFVRAFSEDRAALSQVQRRRSTLSEALRLLVETIFVLALLLVVALLTLAGRPGDEVLSLLGLYAYAGFRLVPSANRITLNLNAVRNGRAFVHELDGDLAALEDRGDERVSEGRSAVVLRDAIRLERVSYAYGAEQRVVLDDVDLTIHRGEAIGLVGPTGAGKSTLVDLLCGLLEPTSGRVLVDGRDIREDVRSWQRQIGYVPQAPYLLDDTLRANVAFGLLPDEIDDAAVGRAVRIAQLEELVASLPDGLETRLGERGAALSGGQRQRVAIARALYHDPQVIVFDEATAALDARTELELARAVEPLRAGRTILVIAHRFSTVRRCDRLVLLRGGRVAATGAYDELMERSAEFRALAAADAAS